MRFDFKREWLVVFSSSLWNAPQIEKEMESRADLPKCERHRYVSSSRFEVPELCLPSKNREVHPNKPLLREHLAPIG